MTGADSSSAIGYRELRRKDLESFEGVMLQGMGSLERATGLDELSAAQFQSLRRRSVWTLFSLVRAVGAAPIRVFVGVTDGRVLGTASVVFLPQAGYVLGVATDSAARRRGIATALLERIHLASLRKGRRWTALDVESDNDTAIRVYRRLGYEEAERFGWYVGSEPYEDVGQSVGAVEVAKSGMEEAAAWVNDNRPQSVREPLPATARRLSHIEVVTRVAGAPVRTWRTVASGRTSGVVRASYVPEARTGFVIPSAWDEGVGGTGTRSLVGEPVRWVRSLGASRTVVVAPSPSDEWSRTLAGFGMSLAVSSTLMVRRSGAEHQAAPPGNPPGR